MQDKQEKRAVPFFNYQFFHQKYGEDVIDVMRDVIKRGAFIMQQDMLEFEKRFAAYLGVEHAVSVANCTDGLMLALRALDIRSGDEVILPSHTFVATAAAVHYAGGQAVLVECGADHLIDPLSISKAITAKTRAIMPVQLNGRTCDMEAIQAIADEHGLLIVEDAAQALGSTFKGKKAGSFGHAAAFSFYPAKILGCFGDGGMVVTDSDEVAQKLKLYRDHGRDDNGNVVAWGGNSRLDNLHAAVLNFFFDKYDEVIERRRHLARLYNDNLSKLAALLLPPKPDADADHVDVFQNYEIEADNRDELQDYLKANGIGTLRQWGGAAIHQFEALGFKQDLPFTAKMTARELMLPMNMSLSDEDVMYVCHHVRKFYEER
jgi:dTDP-4-amino-4,6-dideoxygalactose transaminase